MKIPDIFIENRAKEYTKCIIKPFKRFEQYLWYTWDIYTRSIIKRLNK
jgi:hypothetical protein